MTRKALRLGVHALNWGSNLALVLLVVATLAFVLAPHVLGWRYGILRTGSMSPTMPAGAAIVLAPADMPDLRPGDVITFRSAVKADVLVTHRIVALTQDKQGRPALVTRGDANNVDDGDPVTANRLLGKVVFDVPYGGQVIERLHTKAAFLILTALPAALIIAFELKELGGGIDDLRKTRRKAQA